MNRHSLALKINDEVNRDIEYRTDLSHYGVVELWTLPQDKQGDCEDYALLKRALLLDAGFNSEDLCLCVCKCPDGSMHCVLWVKTEQGGFILDNRYAGLCIPSFLPYTEWIICRDGVWHSVQSWH